MSVSVARAGILEELKRRFIAGDAAVFPLSQNDRHKWHHPQSNYYAGAGEMTCPVCKTGRLRYSRARSNGHVAAACSTDNCVRWME